MPQTGQEVPSTHKQVTKCLENIFEVGYDHCCVGLNARSIMVEDTDPHIIGITESWANIDITDAELGLTGYVMFRRN